METEIVRASEMREKIVDRISEIRDGDRQKQYEKDLRAYLKAKGKREEVVIPETYTTLKRVGYWTMKDGRPAFHDRPQALAAPRVWSHSPRRVIGNSVHAACSYGLLGDALFNRDIRPDRVEKYALEMEAGRWVDLLSDPIAITEDGQVLNGQHRLAAVFQVTEGWSGTDPAFLVIWGVDPQEALYADGSSRTAHDEKTIAVRLYKGRVAA